MIDREFHEKHIFSSMDICLLFLRCLLILVNGSRVFKLSHGMGQMGRPIIARENHIFLQQTVWGDQLLWRTIYLITGLLHYKIIK